MKTISGLVALMLNFVLFNSIFAAQPAGKDVDFKPLQLADLPALDELNRFARGPVPTHGLLATINYERFRKPSIKGEENIVLKKSQTGFANDLTVKVLWQDRPAPLAIPLVGFYQKKEDKLVCLWKKLLFDAGCHVLTFDSIFHVKFNQITGHGVSGNLEIEAQIVARVIQHFLDQVAPRDRIGSIQLLGTSYGGLLALHLERLEQNGQLPFQIDRSLLLSPPLCIKTAAQRVDAFYAQDYQRWDQGSIGKLIDLMKLVDGYKPKEEVPSPKEEALMRAGIGYSFRDELESIVKETEKRYMSGTFDRFKAEEKKLDEERKKQFAEDPEARRTEREARREREVTPEGLKLKALATQRLSQPNDWTFADYVRYLSYPYWLQMGKISSEDELWRQGELIALLQQTPQVQAIVAEDDPLNDPAQIETLKTAPLSNLLLVPHGGHLGFAGARWLEQVVHRFFGDGTKGQNELKTNTVDGQDALED